ncbi:invasion associated locus B family protein [uncultured Bartonella sp.]|uniref:invasion associated locus B family protein n=1 Tax=uncultured Bartonella sp. TaxID=104108 RepID=UPI002633A37F|nr:invasion associated locus B family protein [uncultured Bartonella sp.]
MKRLFCSLFAIALLSLSSSALADNQKGAKPNAAVLPNGASSLTETYGLWTVNCAVQNGEKACALVRQEVNNQNQPVISMNVSSNNDDTVSGVLVVPFGILVTKPIHLKVDDTKAVIQTSVRTCMPAGCIVPIAFDRNAIASLRSGKQLNIQATSAGNNEQVLDNLFVQLDGFGSALDRLTALKK